MSVRILGVWLAVLTGTPGPLSGQSPRETLRQGIAAYDSADDDRAFDLLRIGLNPNGQPLDSAWVSGLHRLVQILRNRGHTAVAAVWLRWGLRLVPDLVVDDVNFPPPFVAAFSDARDFVTDRPASTRGAVTEIEWGWRAPASPTPNGVIHIDRGGDVYLRARIKGGTIVTSGESLSVPAGSYTMLVAADEHLSLNATVEVLPDITTSLRFRLVSSDAGQLYVNSRPWGMVVLDGRSIGHTPLARFPVSPGRHRLRVERVGFMSFDTVMAVQANAPVRIGAIRLSQRPDQP